MGYTERTLEYFRAVGLGEDVPQISPDVRLRRVIAHSLAGEWAQETDWTPGDATDDRGVLSPCTGAAIAQDRLEPILRRRAAAQGSTLMLGTELVSFRQDDQGVVAEVRDRESGALTEISADYLCRRWCHERHS